MESKKQARKNVVVSYAIFASGIILTFAGYLVMLNLQSSINIEDGVGKSIFIIDSLINPCAAQ